MVDLDSAHGRLGHVRHEGFTRVLDDHQSAPGLDSKGPGGAVIERPAQNYGDDPGAKIAGCAAEERIDRRPMAVLAGAFGEMNAAVADQQMLIGWSHISFAGLDFLAIRWRNDRQRIAPGKNLSQRARLAHMLDNKQG